MLMPVVIKTIKINVNDNFSVSNILYLTITDIKDNNPRFTSGYVLISYSKGPQTDKNNDSL